VDVELTPGVFAENILISGDATALKVGDRLQIGTAELEVTQIGKECHADCVIRQKAGDCVMPREGVFARVLTGGEVKSGDEVAGL
jgi:MOSC domain-containing protein YiiM